MEEPKKGNKKLPPKKFDIKTCQKNTMRSLNEVEYFLNNFKRFSRYVKLYKFFK